MKNLIVKTEGKTYEIYIESGLFNRLPGIFQEKYSGKKIALVSDSNVFKLYGNEIFLRRATFKIPSLSVEEIFHPLGLGQENFRSLPCGQLQLQLIIAPTHH